MNFRILSALTLVFLLTACGNNDVRSAMGLKKSAPDEFRVISNPPLSVPPEFSINTPQDHGHSLIDRIENKSFESAPSSEDVNFLRKFGGEEQNSSVKKMIENEYNQEKLNKDRKGAIRKALSKINDSKDPAINPVAERKRISENISAGKAINEGDVKMRNKSTLERIFD